MSPMLYLTGVGIYKDPSTDRVKQTCVLHHIKILCLLKKFKNDIHVVSNALHLFCNTSI